MPQNNPAAGKRNPDDALTERQFLRREQARAKIAMHQSWKRASRNLAYGANPKRAIKEHPWITLGSVIAVGLGVGAVVFQKSRHKEPPPKWWQVRPDDVEEDKAAERRKQRRGRWLIKGLRLLQPLVASMISTAVSAAVKPPDVVTDPSQDPATSGI